MPFCDDSPNFDAETDTLEEELDKFYILFELLAKFEETSTQTNEALAEVGANIVHLREEFLQLFTPQDFRELISNYTKGQAEQLKTIVLETSIQLSELKEQARAVELFYFAPAEQITSQL